MGHILDGHGVCYICSNTIEYSRSEPSIQETESHTDHTESEIETQKVLAQEYHWNEPVAISAEYTIGMHRDNINYWIEIKGNTKNSSSIITMLRYGTSDLGFDKDRLLSWVDHIAESYTKVWTSNGIAYTEMSGYGRNWLVYFSTSDDAPGIFGVKINSLDEFEALVGIEVLD